MSYRSIKRVLGETSLERKCRFLFGACLLLLITASFWLYGKRTNTIIDEYGVTKKMIRGDFERSQGLKGNAGAMSGMSQWLDFPVKDLRSWKEVYETCLRSDNLKDRLPGDWFSGE